MHMTQPRSKAQKMTDKKQRGPSYFKVTDPLGEVVAIIKANHSNVAARSVLDDLGYVVQTAKTDDVLAYDRAGREIKEIKAEPRPKRPNKPYPVKRRKKDLHDAP